MVINKPYTSEYLNDDVYSKTKLTVFKCRYYVYKQRKTIIIIREYLNKFEGY